MTLYTSDGNAESLATTKRTPRNKSCI